MQQSLYLFFAKLVVERLAQNKEIDEEILKEMDYSPMIDNLRGEISKRHDGIKIVKMLLLSNSDAEIVLGLNLSKVFIEKSDENKVLLDMLNSLYVNSNSFWVKINVILRFLDLKKYNTFHLDYLEYILENAKQFYDFCPKWAGGEELITDFVSRRLNDAYYPSAKSWFYILMLRNASKEEIKSLLKTKNIDDQIISRISENWDKFRVNN